MSTPFKQAQSKLERLKQEQEEVKKAIRKENANIPFGQPNIIGRRDIYKDVKRYYAKQRKLAKEQEKQEDRIAMLEDVEQFKQANQLVQDVHVVGKSEYATIGVKTSVNNLDYFRQKLIELEQANQEAKAFNKTKPKLLKKTYGTQITKLKRKIADLEAIQEQAEKNVFSAKTKELIESGAVTQWQKKPIFYFVKGLRKVAFEIDEKGDFFISPWYTPNNEEEETFVQQLLDKTKEN
ncbi:hypothetical protein [Listeria sp. ILCC797]|uniref:hypothetical protein n=1 Tax=Listeria sp. ILCC797 TaxID=1918333 RepID=UPI000B596A8A|nr:hypothetical protein [Listeria sp. ILCC797]